MEFAMKKLILVIVLGLSLGSVSAFAYDSRDSRYDESGASSHGREGLDWRINRLNRMLSHVRWELSRYRGDWRLRHEVERISGEVNRVNYRYRHGFDSSRLRRHVDSLRVELHQIEVRLQVRSGDFYRWD
jgi:hypothetical protein